MLDTFKPLILLASLFVVICVVWYFILYQPDVLKLNVIKDEFQELVYRFQSLRVSDQQILALEAQIKNLQTEIDRTEKKLIQKDNLASIIQQIQWKARTFGLKFERVIPDYQSLMNSPDAKQDSAQVLKLTVHMKLQGYYKNFGKFINSLSEMPFYITLGEMTLLYNETIHPQIDIIVDAVLYLNAATPKIKT